VLRLGGIHIIVIASLGMIQVERCSAADLALQPARTPISLAAPGLISSLQSTARCRQTRRKGIRTQQLLLRQALQAVIAVLPTRGTPFPINFFSHGSEFEGKVLPCTRYSWHGLRLLSPPPPLPARAPPPTPTPSSLKKVVTPAPYSAMRSC